VSVDAGAEDLAAYASSPGTQRSFCRACGTRLFFQSDRWAGETPEGHAFFEEHVAWIPWPTVEP
jgi:hypothetical protein